MVNYNSIEEIISSGITNMEVIRDNNLQHSTFITIDNVDWFSYNGYTVSKINVNSSSSIDLYTSIYDYYRFCVNSVYDCHITSVYREEGTLYNYYKFLKIRLDGSSHRWYDDYSYKLTYDIILWNTGDVSLHMVNIPTSNNTGNYSFNNISYTVNTSSPDITFNKIDNGYEVLNSAIELIKGYYLIRSNTDYYTITDNNLVKLDIEDISLNDFESYGFTKLNNTRISLLSQLDNIEILFNTIIPNLQLNNLIVNSVYNSPKLCYYDSEIILEGAKITKMEVIGSNDALYSITFDNGNTWKYYNNGWKTVCDDSEGMNSLTIKNITQEQWSEVVTSSNVQLRCALFNKDSYTGKVYVNYA